jgi:flagellar export protein FliJ
MSARKRLDRLHAVYDVALDRARSRLGAAQTRADQVARERERIAAMGAEYRRGLDGSRGPLSAAQLKQLSAFVGTLDSGTAVCDAELRRRVQMRDEAHAQWLQARRRSGALERIAERDLVRARVVERRSEQRAADELAQRASLVRR